MDQGGRPRPPRHALMLIAGGNAPLRQFTSRLINHALTNSWSTPITAAEASRRNVESEAYEYRTHCRLDHRHRRWRHCRIPRQRICRASRAGCAASAPCSRIELGRPMTASNISSTRAVKASAPFATASPEPAGDADATERTDHMKCRGNQPMMRTFIVRALSFSAVAALTLNPALTPVVAGDYRTAAPAAATRRADERAPACARDRQIHRDRPAARHQGCAGRRPEDRQRRRPLRPARLYHRRGGGPDQHRILRFGGPADRGL